MSSSQPDPIYTPFIPIEVTPAPAGPRKLKTTWTLEAAESLRDLWATKPDNALDVFNDGLDDPNFDPNKPYHGKERGSGVDLVKDMAKEMAAEIDREILKDLLR